MTLRMPIVVAFALTVLAPGAGIAGVAGPPLLPVPRPAIDRLEPADQEQLREERARLDTLLADAEELAAETIADAYGRLGQVYLLYDLIESARACFLNAAALDAADFRWHYYLGVLHTTEGELPQARSSLERAAELHESDLATRLRLGRVELDLGEIDAAERSFRAALALDAKSAAARHGLGRAAFDRGDYRRAVSELEAALELQPQASSIHHLLGLAQRELGDLERARYHLSRNRFDPVELPDPLVDGLAGLLRSARAHLKAGNRAARDGDLETALEQYRRAAEIAPRDPLVLYNLGWALAQAGAEDEAIGRFRDALALDPDYRNAHYNLAAALARKGRLEEAIAHYERTIEIDPQDHAARLELAGVLENAGYLNRAGGELETLVATLAGLGTAPELLARSRARLVALSEQTGAEGATLEPNRSDTEADIEARPEEAAAEMQIAVQLARSGELAAAAERFGRVIALDPGDERAHLGRGMALVLSGRYADARRALESSREALPQSVALADHLARLLAACPEPEVRDGERALELALAVMRSSRTIDHGETLAMALAEVGRFEEAATLQRRLIADIETAGESNRLPAMKRRLVLYESARPCREPWREG